MYSKSSANFLSREETFILIFIKIWNVIDIRGQPSWYIYISSVKITHILYWFVLNLDIEVKASPRDDYFCNMIKHGAIIILSITSVYCNYSCTSSKDIDAIFHHSTNIKSCMKSCITTQAIHLKYLNVNARISYLDYLFQLDPWYQTISFDGAIEALAASILICLVLHTVNVTSLF